MLNPRLTIRAHGERRAGFRFLLRMRTDRPYYPYTLLVPKGVLSMLGHLVFGRYGAGGERDEHATRNQTRWMERLLSALRRRRH